MRRFARCSSARLRRWKPNELSSQRASARFHLLSRWIHPPARWAIVGVLLIAIYGATVAQEPRTLPCLIAKLHVADNFIDDQEIIIALDLWIAQSRVGPEIPQPISDEMMISMIDLWVRGADCRGL